jgi:ADP-ribose pyrophosphatase YjhB (NUDIX family)
MSNHLKIFWSKAGYNTQVVQRNYLEWLRSQIGNRKIPLAYTSVVLLDEGDRVLLQRRSDFNCWGLPGGVLEIDESLEACARREVYEESGVTVGDLRLVGVYTDPKWDVVYPNGDQVQQYTICFQGRRACGVPEPDGVESLETGFFSRAEIPDNRIPSYYVAMLNDALSDGPPVFSAPTANVPLTPQIETLRKAVGSQPIIAMGATAVVVDENGKLLMGKRLDDGNWDFPGGFLDIGENVAHTAIREAREETGLEIGLERIIGIHAPPELWTYPNGDQTRLVDTLFLAHQTGGVLENDHTETGQLAWFTPREVADIQSHPFVMRRNRAVVNHLASGWFVI